MFGLIRFASRASSITVAAALLGLFSSHHAEAAPVSTFIQAGFNLASDENREYLIDRTLTVTGQIDVGDSLRGSFNINTLNSTGANIGGITPNNEWTAVFQLLVTGKTQVEGITIFSFGPDPGFAGPEGTLCGGVASCIATQPAMNAIVPGAGAMIVMFEDPAKNYAADFTDASAGALAGLGDDGTPHSAPHPGGAGSHTPPSSADVGSGNYVTEEAFIARAADGTRFWTIGFTGGVPNGPGSSVPGLGEGFSAIVTLPGGDNILAAFSFTEGTGFVSNNAGLNRILNAVGETGDGIGLGVVPSLFGGTANFSFTGLTKGVSDRDTPFEATSDISAAFFVVVPHPGSLVLLGVGLLGLVAATRMRSMRR